MHRTSSSRGGGPEGLRHRRGLLAAGQLRRDGARGQPAGAERDRLTRYGHCRPPQQLQSVARGERLAARGITYFKEKFPDAVAHTGSLVADQPSAITKWNGERAAMEHLGYNIVYDQQFDITTTDFNQYVIAMRNAGVKILFVEQMPQNYAAAVVKAFNLQDFHPVLVLGASTYSEELVPDAGGPAAIDGAYLEQGYALYLGEDAASVPAVNTFLTWVQNVSPGFKPDLFTLFGWLSGALFAEALQSAGRIRPEAQC